MRKSHPVRRVVLATAATVSGIVLLLSLKPASDPAAASAQGAAPPSQVAVAPTASGGPSAAGGASATADPSAGSSAPGSAPGASKPGASKPGASKPGASAQGAAPTASSEPGSAASSRTARTVTGSVADTPYGPVQVRITVTSGRITAAQAVQSPSGGRSSQISGDAVPKLNQAAVAAQSADIDTVSGASYTSKGYRTSLQSALDQADG
ncbi:FMN-binding protein [Streptomyces sp. NPDC002896]|uniref:FMN-binding protein n=1 Tax=Streptomyces sp. NPDC002896 TaxID=3154438 RepID=UPI00331ECBD2